MSLPRRKSAKRLELEEMHSKALLLGNKPMASDLYEKVYIWCEVCRGLAPNALPGALRIDKQFCPGKRER